MKIKIKQEITLHISFWFMYSNHTLQKINAKSFEEIELKAIKLFREDGSGMLCRPTLILSTGDEQLIGTSIFKPEDFVIWKEAFLRDLFFNELENK